MSAAKTTPALKKPARCITDASVMSSCSNKLQISQAEICSREGIKGSAEANPEYTPTLGSGVMQHRTSIEGPMTMNRTRTTPASKMGARNIAVEG